MDYIRKYVDIGMFNADPEDHSDGNVLKNFVGNRKAVFCTSMQALSSTRLENGDEIGLMPFISEDGETYRVAFTANSYTEEVGQTYNVQIEKGSLSTFVRIWLEEQGTVSPDENLWE